MLKIYKDLLVCYFIAAIGGACFFIGLWNAKPVTMLIAPLWILFCAIFFEVRASLRYTKLRAIMAERCCCREFIAQNEKLLAKAPAKSKTTLLLNHAAGYCNLGEAEKSLSCLMSFAPIFSDKIVGLVNAATYYNNLFAVYSSLDDIEKAEKALADFKAVLQNPKFPEKSRSASELSNLSVRDEFLLQMKKGDYTGAVDFFLADFQSAETKLQKVADAYTLAKIYIHSGNPAAAEKYIDFAAQNGGDTIFAVKARDRAFS